MDYATKTIIFSTFLVFATLNSTAFTGDGSGTPTDPYKIENVEQLQSISQEQGSYYVLENDIDASERGFDTGFTPIKSFSGTLDGQGHEIKNLKINKKSEQQLEDIYRIGLFQKISNSGKVMNLGLEDPQITISSPVGELGFLTGINNGNITRTYVDSGKISIDNVRAPEVGGLAGKIGNYDAKSSIKYSYVDGKVQAGSESRHVGGIVGLSGEKYDGEIKHVIKESYANVYVSGGENLGAIIGSSRAYSTGPNTVDLKKIYYNRDLSPQTPAVGKGTYSGEGLTKKEMKNQENFKNWNFNQIWTIGEEKPQLKGISGTSANPKPISNTKEYPKPDQEETENSSNQEASSNTVKNLRNTVQRLNNTIQLLRQENQRLKSQVEGTTNNDQLSELRQENNELKERNNELEQRVEELEQKEENTENGNSDSSNSKGIMDLIFR